RSNDSQVGRILFRKCHQSSDVPGIHGHAFGVRSDSTVSGNAPDSFHARTLLQPPHHGVLAPASADHQNLHFANSSPTTLSNDRRDFSACQPSPMRCDSPILRKMEIGKGPWNAKEGSVGSFMAKSKDLTVVVSRRMTTRELYGLTVWETCPSDQFSAL